MGDRNGAKWREVAQNGASDGYPVSYWAGETVLGDSVWMGKVHRMNSENSLDESQWFVMNFNESE